MRSAFAGKMALEAILHSLKKRGGWSGRNSLFASRLPVGWDGAMFLAASLHGVKRTKRKWWVGVAQLPPVLQTQRLYHGF